MVKRYIDTATAIFRFLKAARNRAKEGMSKEQILDFARREFGEVSKLLRKQIDDIFKAKLKTEKKGDVVPIKKQEGIVRRPEEFATRKEYERYLDETLGPSDDVFGSPMKDDLLKEWDKVNAKNVTPNEGIMATDEAAEIVKKRTDDIATGDVTGETSDLMTKIESDLENLKKTNKKLQEKTSELTDNPFDDFYNYVLKGQRARDPKVGMVRTAAREILEKNKVKIGGEDPIEVLRQMYGEKGLEAIDAVSDSLLDAQSYGEINTILTQNKLFDLVPKKTYGYDESVVTAEKIRKAKEQEAKQRQILEDFDPTDRTKNADGGLINILKL